MYQFTKYEAGEVPPKVYDCPFHPGNTLPCQPCLAWLYFDPDTGLHTCPDPVAHRLHVVDLYERCPLCGYAEELSQHRGMTLAEIEAFEVPDRPRPLYRWISRPERWDR